MRGVENGNRHQDSVLSAVLEINVDIRSGFERGTRCNRGVVVGETDLVAYLLAEAERQGIEIVDDVDVVNVVDAHLAYFEAIGAVGPKAIDL
jgi:hypothetical protein